MVHLTTNDYKELQGAILASIENQYTWADVEINGIRFYFTLSYATKVETEYTGVEFMGAREHYTKRTAVNIVIKFTGAYDSEDEEVKTDYRCGQLKLNSVVMD